MRTRILVAAGAAVVALAAGLSLSWTPFGTPRIPVPRAAPTPPPPAGTSVLSLMPGAVSTKGVWHDPGPGTDNGGLDTFWDFRPG